MKDRFATSEPNMPRHKGRRMGTMWFSYDFSECDVTLAPVFDDISLEARLKCLHDAISILTWEYEDQKKKLKKFMDGKNGRHTDNKG